jgi:glucose/arabinose dehydrogenase
MIRGREIFIIFCAGFLLIASVSVPSLGAESRLPLEKITLPPGFHISLFARDVPKAREMALSPNGTVFVGSFAGNVYALPDEDRDGKADRVITIAHGLDMPVGVDFLDGSLYVSAVTQILRYDAIESRLNDPPNPVVLNATFPAQQNHRWKFIRFGPDRLLYVPVGAPCNVCDEKDPRFASIMRMKLDGTGIEVFARGIRNTVGFDWHPATRELWFTDNGRDWMGDEIPPDELNVAPREGLFFGFPYCHGGDITDPELGKGRSCKDYVPPAMKLGPHVAALGMRFYTGKMFPQEYRDQIFVAEHGSWNRSK